MSVGREFIQSQAGINLYEFNITSKVVGEGRHSLSICKQKDQIIRHTKLDRFPLYRIYRILV